MEDDFKLIHSYTNEDALEDGEFLDVTELAKTRGFNAQFIITASLFGFINQDEQKLLDLMAIFNHMIIQGKNQYEDQAIYKDEDGAEYWLFIEHDGVKPNFKLILSSDY